MAYYIRVDSGAGGSGNAALRAVHLGQMPLSPLNIRSVVGARSNAPGHAFEIEDFSFDIEQVLSIGSASSGAGAGKVNFNPFSVTKKIDSASPLFFKTLVPGKHIPKVKLEIYRDEGPEELPAFTIDLTNAVTKGTQPVRQFGIAKQPNLKSSDLTRIKFSFQKIEFTWKSGGVTAKDDWTK